MGGGKRDFRAKSHSNLSYLSAPLENNTQRENFLLDLGIVTLEDFTKALSCSPNFLPQVGILSSQDLDALGVRYRPVAHLKLPSLIDILAALKGMGTGLHARVKDVFKNSMPQSEIPWGSFLKKIDALYAQIEAQEGLLALFQPESHPNLMTRVNALINEFNTLHQAHLKEKLRAYISQENLASIWQDFQARGIDSLTILEFSSDEQMTEAYLFRMGKQQ